MQVTPKHFSDADLEAYYTELLSSRATDAGLTAPPQVSRVGWATSLSEYGDQMARCLQDAGFPAVSDGAGGTAFKPGVPPSQEAALDEATYVCNARYPLHPAIAEGWSEEQVGLVYDYWDQYYIPCMEAHGHPISRADQPSREAYVGAFNSPQRISWWPNSASIDLPIDERRALSTVCPEYPPAEVMYGF